MTGDRRRGADPSLLLLISLAGGPKHGHAMLLDIESFSGQRLGPGTLYGAIERLELDGLVEALPADDRRTPYRLTSAGSDYLARRIDGLQVLAGVGRSRLSA
ncbi:MAG: PadR family transcriptional regulator [Chloroflexota bacterium]